MSVALRLSLAALAACWLLASGAQARAGDSAATPQAAPADLSGVLLDDGRQIEGTYEEKAGQRWIITPKAGGKPLDVSVVRIVVAEKGGDVDVRGDDSAAAKIWRAAARTAYEAKKSESEDAAKAAQLAVLDKGVEWCKKREFPTAPTALLNDMARIDSKTAADVETRAKTLMPEGFFFKDKPDAVKQWMAWADALLPSSAEFVEKSDEDVWGRLENKPWTDGQTLCFRTRNVLLFIRDQDPIVCGRALQLAEGTVRALQLFLHDGQPDVVSSDLSRLEIRIHKNRADYLAEKPAHGRAAETWSAGYFSPLENVSHFYVERGSAKSGAIDWRELTRVLTHEFTHHYMTGRWAPSFIRAKGALEDSSGPGFWVVEGMAEFVQNQMHKINERGMTFDDDNVAGILDVARARRAGLTSNYLSMENFIDMSQGAFTSLSDEPMTGGGRAKVFTSERILWYDQAGALSYFFLQKKGPEMRKLFVKYVADHYAGNSHVPGWKYFGYDSAKALDDDFNAFLNTVKI